MSRLKLILPLLLLSFVVPLDIPGYTQEAQLDEMDLIQRVADLQHQLGAEQMSDRDRAESELVELGPRVLDHLDDPSADMPLDVTERIARVRTKLETLAVRAASKPSTVMLDGKLSVEQSLAQIKTQTGNDVAISDEAPADTGTQLIDWAGNPMSFWDAIAKIEQESQLLIDPYAADATRLRLAPANQRSDPNTLERNQVQVSADMFLVQVTRVDATRNLTYPDQDHVNVQLQIRWEPRLSPISLKLPMNQVSVKDSNQNNVPVLRQKSVLAAMVQPQIPQIELSVPLKPIARDVQEIESVTATLEATLPGRIESFRFRRIGKLEPGKKIRRAGATVTFEGIDRNEELFGVVLSLTFDEELNALESHQSWAFDNEVYLEDQTGKTATPLTYESIRQDNDRVAVTYYFADDPGERTLIYKTPAAILQTQSKIELKNIPLP